MWHIYALATSTAVHVVNAGMYYCIFENLSVMTKIALNTSDTGNSPTKSIVISSHGLEPVGIGTSLVWRAWQSVLLR